MAIIAPVPVYLNNPTLKIGPTNNYETSLSSVELIPTTPTTTWKGFGGSNFNFVGETTWVANITYVQDFETAGSFALYLLEGAGETVDAELYIKSGGTGYSLSLILQPGPFGGALDSVAVGTVTLQVNGQPAEIVV